MASTDKITDVYNAARPNSARATATRAVGGTTLTCDDLTGWPTASKVHFATYQIDSNSDVVAGTQTDWEGEVSGSSIGSLLLRGGTDQGNASGDVVEMLPTAAWAQDLADGINLEHSRTGAHEEELITSRTADTSPASGDSILTSDVSDSNNLKKVTISNLFANIPAGSVETADIADDAVTPDKMNFGADTATVLTSETTTATSPADLTTPGPAVTVTVPASGKVLVAYFAKTSNSTVGNRISFGVELSGANTIAADTPAGRVTNHYTQVDGDNETNGLSYLHDGLTPGSTTFTMKYYGQTGTKTFHDRILSVIPIGD